MPGKKDNDKLDPSIKQPRSYQLGRHDVYVGMKWSSLVTIRAVHSQAKVPILRLPRSPVNDKLSRPKRHRTGPRFLRRTPFRVPFDPSVRVAYGE
jgi:hypothetical protein